MLVIDGEPQEIFDKVVKHLIKQGQRSYISGMGCTYRSEDGTKCAIGCLIPDDEYSPCFEKNTVNDLIHKERLSTPHAQLLISLQDCHDRCISDKDFNRDIKIRLKQAAEFHGLLYKENEYVAN